MRYKLTIQFLGFLLIGFIGFLPGVKAAPGDLDPTFAFTGFVKETIGEHRRDQISGTAIQTDGKIVAAGTVYYGGYLVCGVTRYNTDGSLDTSFDGDGKILTQIGAQFSCYDVDIQADGKIVVAGYSNNNSNFDFTLVRYNPDGSLDTTFDGDGKVRTDFSNSSDLAYKIAIQADGKIVVAGSSDGGSDSNFALARYNSDGSLDTSFDGDGKVTTDFFGGMDYARTLAIQADGKIVAGGNCASPGSSVYNDFALARYNPDGSLDTTFDGDGKIRSDIFNFHDNVNALAIQPDGKVVAAGQSSLINNTWSFSLVRYNPNGSLDTSFNMMPSNLNYPGFAYAVAVQTDGKIVVGGDGRDGSNNRFSVIRLNSNGSLDSIFARDETNVTYSLAIQADGKIIAAGVSNNNLSTDFGVARYNLNGSFDTSFDGDGKVVSKLGGWESKAREVAIQPDGKIIVVGSASNGRTGGGQIDFALARYSPDGSLDASFGSDGTVLTDFGDFGDNASAVAIQADGKIVVAGTANGYSIAFARYNPNGSLDTSFDSDGKLILPPGGARILEIAIQADGKIVAAGYDGADFMVLRYNPNGSPDPTFDGDGKVTTDFFGAGDFGYAIAIQADGKIVVGGDVKNGEFFDFGLARYNPNGSLDTSFDGDGKVATDFSNFDDQTTSMAIQADGKIIAAGYSNNNSNFDFALARYNPDGSLDPTFDGDGKVITPVRNDYDVLLDVAIQTDGRIVAAGFSSNFNGLNEDLALVRYKPDGTLDNTYGNGGKVIKDFSNYEISSYRDQATGIALDSNGSAIVVGESGGLFLVSRFLGNLASENTLLISTATGNPIFLFSDLQRANGGICVHLTVQFRSRGSARRPTNRLRPITRATAKRTSPFGVPQPASGLS